jgi:hypothetical protein
MKKLVLLILLFPALIFGTVNFGTRLLVYPSTFSVNLNIYVNKDLILTSEVYVVWWLKVGFKLKYPSEVKDIFVMGDFSNDLDYATYLPNDNVYVGRLGDNYSTLDFFKKYVIQIIRNYYIYGQDKEEIPITNTGYYIKINKDASLKEIDFNFSSNAIRFVFSDWNFDISQVMDEMSSFINKNKVQMK